MVDQTQKIILETLRQVAGLMLVAAKTAPKARGLDNLEIQILEKDKISEIIKKMREIYDREGASVFSRDAETLEQVDLLFLIGTRISAVGLKYCGLCGFKNCAEMEVATGICVFNPGDLGIALGSAVTVAANHHVDNRVLYSAGMAALELGILGADVKIALAVPLTGGPKNPFFDRK